MTQKDKELLFKDLCARLPYGVKVQHQHQDYLDEIQTIEHIARKYGEIETESVLGFVDDFKPYLRPMSSMTEEEYNEYRNIDNRSYTCPIDYAHIPAQERINWLNKKMFDYHGLIEKGLAIKVTEENNPYKLD